MIVQIRGTSGSGKSTVMKSVMSKAGNSPWTPVHVSGRKRPLYYVYRPLKGLPIIVLGHYESACGGCDTIGSARSIYELVDEIRKQFETSSILMEGLLLSEDVKWTSQPKYIQETSAVYLDTDVEVCLKQIKHRRESVGNQKELNPNNTVNRIKTIERSRVKLIEAGMRCVVLSPKETVPFVLKLLGKGD